MQDPLIDEAQRYLNALLAGDRIKAADICSGYLTKSNNVFEVYESVMKPALYEVGRLWETNKITVASEHLATAITEGILNTFYEQIVPERYNGKRVVLTCVEHELHQVGLKMVADVFEKHQWETFFLGTGLPLNDLIQFIKEKQPHILAISLSVFFNFTSLQSMISKLRIEFPQMQMLIGGQAFRHINLQQVLNWKNITQVSDLRGIESYIANFKA